MVSFKTIFQIFKQIDKQESEKNYPYETIFTNN